MSTKSHWEKIYTEKSPQEVSWTQETPVTSIEFFEDFKLNKTSPIIDIGGGESKFVDYLLDNEYQNISVLDISESAIKRTKDRLGEKSLTKLFTRDNIAIKRVEYINHTTPFETTQNFIFCSFSSK